MGLLLLTDSLKGSTFNYLLLFYLRLSSVTTYIACKCSKFGISCNYGFICTLTNFLDNY
jgi:hypothetical protein